MGRNPICVKYMLEDCQHHTTIRKRRAGIKNGQIETCENGEIKKRLNFGPRFDEIWSHDSDRQPLLFLPRSEHGLAMNRDGRGIMEGDYWGRQQGYMDMSMYQQQHQQPQQQQFLGGYNFDAEATRGFSTITPAEFQQACYFMEKMISAEETNRNSSLYLLQNPANAHVLPVLNAIRANWHAHPHEPVMDLTGRGSWGLSSGTDQGSYSSSESGSQEPLSFAQKAKDLWAYVEERSRSQVGPPYGTMGMGMQDMRGPARSSDFLRENLMGQTPAYDARQGYDFSRQPVSPSLGMAGYAMGNSPMTYPPPNLYQGAQQQQFQQYQQQQQQQWGSASQLAGMQLMYGGGASAPQSMLSAGAASNQLPPSDDEEFSLGPGRPPNKPVSQLQQTMQKP